MKLFLLPKNTLDINKDFFEEEEEEEEVKLYKLIYSVETFSGIISSLTSFRIPFICVASNFKEFKAVISNGNNFLRKIGYLLIKSHRNLNFYYSVLVLRYNSYTIEPTLLRCTIPQF